jgi:hypothetical protein
MSWGWQRYPVDRLRPAHVPDGHGNLRPDFTGVTPEPIGAWLWAPSTAATQEQQPRELGVRVAGNLYGPAVVDVAAGDAVTFEVGRFRVIGEPQRWRPGTVLEVERWDG